MLMSLTSAESGIVSAARTTDATSSGCRHASGFVRPPFHLVDALLHRRGGSPGKDADDPDAGSVHLFAQAIGERLLGVFRCAVLADAPPVPSARRSNSQRRFARAPE